MNEFDKVLDDNEKVLWEGKPKFWPFLLGNSILSFVFGVFFMLFFIPFIIIALISAFQGSYLGLSVFLLPHFWIGTILVFGIPIYQFLVYKHVHYAITNKRVLFQKGLIGRDFEMVDFDQMTNVEVNVGIIDILFGGRSGSILVSTAGSFTYSRNRTIKKPYIIRSVSNPYEVFKFFKKVSHDVKTDINYPNKFRPGKNSGYKTEYDGFA